MVALRSEVRGQIAEVKTVAFPGNLKIKKWDEIASGTRKLTHALGFTSAI